MRIEYDKGSILELRMSDDTYTYALCLGKGVKDKANVYDDLADYGNIAKLLFSEDSSTNFKLDVLFGSTKDVITNEFAFPKLHLLYTWFSSEIRLPLDKVVKGFQKYPFFTYFFVNSHNKVTKKEVITDKWAWNKLEFNIESRRVMTRDCGFDLKLFYLKSCVLLNRKPEILLTVKEYYEELVKDLVIFREKVKDSFVEDILYSYSENLTKGSDEIDLDSGVNRLYLVETKNQYYLFSYLFQDLYIQVGKIDKVKSSKHDKAYFMTLLQPDNAFIEQERYKTVRRGFKKFLETNKNNIQRITYYPYNVMEDLDLQNPKLKLNEDTYSILDSYYNYGYEDEY